MKKALILLAVTVMCTVSAFAQWVRPVPTFSDLMVDGSTIQYLYNVEAKGFLLGANNWDTRASISKSKGYRMMFSSTSEASETGNYTIPMGTTLTNVSLQDYAETTPTGAMWSEYDCTAFDNIWCDGAGRYGAGAWQITAIKTKRYNISNAHVEGGLFGWAPYAGDSTNTRCWILDYTQTDGSGNPLFKEKEACTTWAVVSVADYEAWLSQTKTYEKAVVLGNYINTAEASNPGIDLSRPKAVYENTESSQEELEAALNEAKDIVYQYKYGSLGEGTDFTNRIVNPDFKGGDTSGWQTGFTVSSVYENAECWNKNFNVYQNLTGLPAGLYRLSVQGFYRQGGNDQDYAANVEGSGIPAFNATIYAMNSKNENISAPIMCQSAGATKEQLSTNGSASVGNGLYVPNSMEAARNWFDAGYYLPNNEYNTVFINVEEDGLLTIGVQKYTTINNDWAIFDNFTLTYYGDAELPGDSTVYDQLTNADFMTDSPEAVGIRTYIKDVQNNGDKAQNQPVTGWTINGFGDAHAGGIFQYGSEAFLGGEGYLPPTTGPDGQPGQALGLLAVWAATTQYTQKVNLPAGTYTLNIDIYNAGGTGAITTNLFGVNDTYSPVATYPVGEWTTETFSFTLSEAQPVTISLGYEAGNAGSGSMPHLFIDKVSIDGGEEPNPYETIADSGVISVAQVTNTVTLTGDVDYVITSDTPFATSGSINIENTDHAVVILSSIKPSIVISSWLSHIYINGAQAVNDENCQVKMYNRGAIILPYDKNFRPLTCYTEPNYEGEMCDNYTEGSSGGFMKTLTTATLNNQIRSFKLKRGYMVTFALGTGGWGYSRCFIADQEDLEFASLPNVMDKRISSYRIFKWHNAHKAGLASNGDNAANQALNTSWCYDWAQGNASNMPDTEWVPNHIYEDYPSPATCGGVTGSCHMKTNNEPRNTSDDHPQELETILNNWPNLMRTGMRLCTPSSWDGSDYWNGTGFIKTFLDSIDARGWRCDIVDAHCYWNESNFGYLSSQWFPNMHRPIWISEWIWGASWNQNGAFGNGTTDAEILATTKRILDNLNSMDCVERYAYWNSESKAHIYENGSLTELGKYYASMETGLGYKQSNEFIPRVAYCAPTGLTGTYAQAKGTFTMTWNDDNGDMLDSISVECKLPGATRWVRLATLPLKDKSSAAGAAYSYIDTLSAPGAYYYRVGSYPIGNKTAKYSDEVSVTVSSSLGNEIFQYGILNITNTDAVTTSFSERFSETPAIFMGICSNQNATLYPGNLITSASSTKFNYQILPWTEQSNGVTELTKAEEIPFMALKSGNYKCDELDCEVGITRVGKDSTTVTFQQPFPEGVTPIVLVELRNPTLKTNAIAINIWDVTNTGFKAMLQYEEGLGKSVNTALTTSYLAITPGMGHISTRTLLHTDTVRIETLHPNNFTDSIVYTLRHTYQAQPLACVVAGTSENNMYGASARQCTFAVGTDTLYFQSPSVFGKCQTNKYPAAAILRKSTEKKVTDNTSEYYNYIYGANIKRQVDGTSTTTAKNTTANSDVLGYVVLGEPRKAAGEEVVEEIIYTVQERTDEYTEEYIPIAGADVNFVDLSTMNIDWRNLSNAEFTSAIQQIDWANVEALVLPKNSGERIAPYLSKANCPKLLDIVVLEDELPVEEMKKVDFNPNLMIRMQEGTKVLDGNGNIVAAPANVFIGGKAERVVLTDRSPYQTGYSYKDGNYYAKQIEYKRTFNKLTRIGQSGGWEALVLPFSVQKITTADGRTLAPFGSEEQADANFWLAELGSDGWQPATSIYASKPYIIAMPNNAEYDAQYNVTGEVTFSAEEDSLYVSQFMWLPLNLDMSFTPNYADIALTEAANLFTLNDETYETYLPGGAFVRGLRGVRPFEAYVTQSAGAKPRRALPIVLPEPTALYQIAAEKAQKTDGVIYDLTGRRVKAPTRGIYIQDGKKVLVK